MHVHRVKFLVIILFSKLFLRQFQFYLKQDTFIIVSCVIWPRKGVFKATFSFCKKKEAFALITTWEICFLLNSDKKTKSSRLIEK